MEKTVLSSFIPAYEREGENVQECILPIKETSCEFCSLMVKKELARCGGLHTEAESTGSRVLGGRPEFKSWPAAQPPGISHDFPELASLPMREES